MPAIRTLLLPVIAGAMALASARAGDEKPIELIIRGDDMGHSHGVNLGFVKAHREGILTSASVMVPAPYFDEAVKLCKENPKMAAGIHITLLATVPMRPVLHPDEIPTLVTPGGYFHHSGTDLVKAKPSIHDIEKEIRAQIDKARAAGLHFVYLDTHMNGYASELGVNELVLRICQEKRLLFGNDRKGTHLGAVRLIMPMEQWHSIRLEDGRPVYWPHPELPEERKIGFYKTLESLKPGVWFGVVHPALHRPQQAAVVELLCSAKTKEIIKRRGIRLISHADLWERKFGKQARKR